MSYRDEIINLTNAKPSGVNGSFVGHCVVHNDKNPSLSIKFSDNNRNPLLKCHAGCSGDDLVNEFKNRYSSPFFESI